MKRDFSVGNVTRFYVPLLLQAFSQSLTYPLVAGIVTHGAHGVNALTAFSQGQMIMFMIGALGGGLVTTGLVFAKTYFGYVTFKRLNALMMAALLALQCVPALPGLDDWVFGGFFHLPPDLASVARETLLWGVFMNAGFFLRNAPMVVLSTASPFKFPRDVLTALGVEAPASDFAAMAALTAGTGAEAPASLRELDKLEVRFKTVLQPADIRTAALR